MQTPEKVLIINFHFPPYPGIGGRRWALFSKQLTKKGIDVSVIAAQNPFQEISAWNNDISPQIKTHYLPHGYPFSMLKKVETVRAKFFYRFSKYILLLSKKGTIYDLSVNWKKTLLKTVNKIVREQNIKNIVVSGAPFRIMYFATELLNNFQHINLISDFRDQWIESEAYGFTNLSKKRMDYEKKMEKTVVTKSSYIITPCISITNLLKSKYPHCENKIITISHAFDINNYNLEKTEKNKDKIRIIYGGTLDYVTLKPIFEELLSALLKIKLENLVLFNKIEIVFYTNTTKYSSSVEEKSLSTTIKFIKTLPQTDFFKVASQSNFLLMINPDAENEFGTKFYDYLPFRKPILLISKNGSVGKYLQNHKIGFLIEEKKIYENLSKILSETIEGKIQFDNNFNIEQFSLEKITNDLIKLFK